MPRWDSGLKGHFRSPVCNYSETKTSIPILDTYSMFLIHPTNNKTQTGHLGPRTSSSKERILLGLRIGALLCQLNCVVCFAWALTEHEKGIAYIDGLGSSWSSINLGTVSSTPDFKRDLAKEPLS